MSLIACAACGACAARMGLHRAAPYESIYESGAMKASSEAYLRECAARERTAGSGADVIDASDGVDRCEARAIAVDYVLQRAYGGAVFTERETAAPYDDGPRWLVPVSGGVANTPERPVVIDKATGQITDAPFIYYPQPEIERPRR